LYLSAGMIESALIEQITTMERPLVGQLL
jgi:hypothetical protein